MRSQKKATFRFHQEHLDIFKTLVKEYNQADSVQDLIIDLIDYTLKNKYGIHNVKSWPRFKFDATYSYSLTIKKTGNLASQKSQESEIKQHKEGISCSVRNQIKESYQEREPETQTSKNETTKENKPRMKQDYYPENKVIPRLYDNEDYLIDVVKKLNNQGKNKEADELMENHEKKFPKLVEEYRSRTEW